jgi:prolipoprotein diacylglyceryl transferase
MISYITWDPSPSIIDFGFYELRWYSMLFALGFILSYIILNRQFKKSGLSQKHLDSLTAYVVIATVVGARLAHCFFYDWGYYSDHLLEIFLPVRFEPSFQFTGFQGLASHGGIFGVAVAIYLFARKYHVNKFWLYDQLSIVGALAGACIRFGNLMNSEIIGKPTDVAWAFIFVRVDDIPRHPGQLYEALAYLSIFVILYFVNKYRNSTPGFLFGLFFTLLFSSRFLIEFVKADQSDFEAGMLLNMGQLLSIPFILFGIAVMIMKRKKHDQPVDVLVNKGS